MTIVARQPSKVRSPWRYAAGIAASVSADVAFDPVHRHVPLCPFKEVTGWDCPLCGGLRATDQLAHGHVAASLHANMLLVGAIPLVAWFWLDALRRHRAGQVGRIPRWATVLIIGIAVAFTVVRNLPGMAAINPG